MTGRQPWWTSDAALSWALIAVVMYRANQRTLPPPRALLAWLVWQGASRGAYAVGRIALYAETAYRNTI